MNEVSQCDKKSLRFHTLTLCLSFFQPVVKSKETAVDHGNGALTFPGSSFLLLPFHCFPFLILFLTDFLTFQRFF